MKKTLSLSQIEHLNLVPVASIALSTSRFRDRGFHFEQAADDLDAYEIAAFEITGQGAFALTRYCNAPADSTDLRLESHNASGPALPAILRSVAEALDLPVALIHWTVDGEPAQLSSDAGSKVRAHA